MKLSELKNEQAIEALADMFDPIVELASDPEIRALANSDNKISLVKLILKNHAKSIFEIMALSEGVPADEYECNILTLPAKLLELFNSPEFGFLFPSQGQTEEPTSSGSATETTEGAEN